MSRLETILASFGCRRHDAEGACALVSQSGVSVLFFSGREGRYDEADDVAVALRELQQEWPEIVRVAALESSAEAQVMKRFGVMTAPSLSFFRDGRPIGQIPRIKTWAAYMERTAAILSGQEHGVEARNDA